MVTLKMAEVSGHQFLEKLGVNDIKAARELSADKIQSAPGTRGADAILAGF